MVKLFSKSYSLIDSTVLIYQGRRRIANQIFQVWKNIMPQFPFSQAKVLDIGSSNGVISKYLLPNVKSIYCIDTDKLAISIGQKMHNKTNLKFAIFDGKHIPFANSSFDLIIFRRVYEYSQYPKALVDEIYRVLKRDGLVYFESHNRSFPNLFPLTPISPSLKIKIFNLLGLSNYYFGNYPTYWQLKKRFHKFEIKMMTAKILINPHQFRFTRLNWFAPISQMVPSPLFHLIEPLLPVFIWVLKKSS